jgi:hypothetical protein
VDHRVIFKIGNRKSEIGSRADGIGETEGKAATGSGE